MGDSALGTLAVLRGRPNQQPKRVNWSAVLAASAWSPCASPLRSRAVVAMRAVALRPLLVLLAAPAHGFSGAGRAPRPLHRRGCDRGGQGGARVALLRIRMEEASTTLGCKYDHLQFFVDDLRPLSHYKAIEDRLNEFARLVPRAEGAPVDIAAAREVWRKMGDSADPNAFEVHGRDLVEQMLYGFGWRITGQHEGAETRSLLLSTPDAAGVS